MAKQRESFFWVSYSDMMTSLFFIMLLLFVLSSAGMFLQKKASEEQLKRLEEVQTTIEQLDTRYFEEDSINKRWNLRQEFTPKFNTSKYDIKDVNLQTHAPLNDTIQLIKVGNSLLKVVENLNKLKLQPTYKDMNLSFLVVIEGMASKDNYFDNDDLSYRRALSLYYLWRENGVSFEDSDCEVQVSGSGVRGIGRIVPPPTASPKEAYDIERQNQRIVIQIVPKIGHLDVTHQ